MDLSLMPQLTTLERQIIQTSDVKEMFIEKFQLMIEQKMAEDEQRYSQSSEQSINEAATKKSRYQLPRDTHEFESRVLYNGVPVPIKVPTSVPPETVGDFSLVKLITTFSTPHSNSPQAFPIHPHLTTSGPYTHPIMVLINALLTQKRIIFLGHNMPSGNVAEAVLAACALASGGLLKGFTRHAFPYTDLTKIDDLLKVPGFIAGVTNPAFAHKPEWWDILCDLSTGRMKISTKIEPAPISPEALAILTNVPGGLSKEILTGDFGNGKHTLTNDPTGDTAFMESVTSAISNRLGEAVVRNKFRAWVHRFTLIAAAFEELVFGASRLNIGANEIDNDACGYGVAGHGLVWPDETAKMREVQANVGRVEGWMQTRSWYTLCTDLARQWSRGECVRGIDLGYQLERLRTLKMGDQGAADVYLALARSVERAGVEIDDPDYDNPILDLDDEAFLAPDGTFKVPDEETEIRLLRRERARFDVINMLLCVTPESSGGLFYISLGLFHRDPGVRLAMMGLLERIMIHEAGRHFWAALGRFPKLAFFRAQRDLNSAAGGVGGTVAPTLGSAAAVSTGS
jgi:Stabilization of polarity axis